MTPAERKPMVVQDANDYDVLLTRDFDAPIELVFEVLTQPEHLEKTFAPFGETMKECDIDVKVGGRYKMSFVTDDGIECAFRGTVLELDPPRRIVQTWLFEGWPEAEGVESTDLSETDGVTTMTYRLAFKDKAGRAKLVGTDGHEANFNHVEDLLHSLTGHQ